MRFKYFLAVMCILCLFACGQKNDNLAVIDGKAVTENQFESFLKFKRINTTDEVSKAKVLDQYIEREALAAAVEKKNLLDTDMMAAELNEFRKEMLISRYFETFLKDKVTDQAVRNYYDTHAGDYEIRKVHTAHILVRTNSKMSETERKVKLTTAQEAYSKINTGRDFAEIANDYSEDKVSAKKGGDLGWLKEGSIDARFSKTIFELEEGAVSEPFETPFGFHVVKILEAPRTIKRPFEEVAGDIRHQLRNGARQAELEQLTALVKVQRNKYF